MVNRENHGLTKSGVMRRQGVTRGRGVGRPPGRPPSSYRASNPNTRQVLYATTTVFFFKNITTFFFYLYLWPLGLIN